MKTRLVLLTTLLAVATAVVGQNRYLDNIKKAEAGDAEAQFEVGKAYDLGEGVEKDLAQAAVWYKKSASQGNMKAQNNLGLAYKNGEGVEKDLNEATKWLKKSAEQGNKHGMFTYYLLKKLQETKGDVTLGDLGDYLTREVRRESFDENSKLQTPTVIPSQALAGSWQQMKLK